MLRCWSCLEQFDVQTARIFFDARVVPCDKPANLSRSIGHDQLAAMMILHQLLIVELWQTKMICKHSELIDSSSKNLIYSQKSFTRLLCTAHSGDDRMLAGESAIVETVSMSRPRGWGAGGSGGEANISWSTDQMTRPTYQIKPTYQSSYIYIKIIKINIYIYILYVSYSNPWFPNSLESFGNGFVKARTFAGKIVIMIGDKIKLVYRIYHLWHLMLFDKSNPTITYNNGPWNILFQHITDVCGTSCNAMWRIW